MRRHWGRTLIYILGDDEPIEEPAYLSGGETAPAEPPATVQTQMLRFGRMFDRRDPKDKAEEQSMVEALTRLGRCMSGDAAACRTAGGPAVSGDSDTPSGYTYLGQFIAHEITFHKTEELPFAGAPLPVNLRSPQIDLDSLYGAGPDDPDASKRYEPDKTHLKFGWTTPVNGASWTYPNDLPRARENPKAPLQALIGDPRNDENLAVAQTHVAFVKFHNKVVDALAPTCPADKLFECARKAVVQHFQWLILEDYLPRLVEKSVLNCARRHPPVCFKAADKAMPVEFSAAAFRIGHSMVRGFYDWNIYHSAEPFRGGPAQLLQLFKFTNFSGDLGGVQQLPSNWVIDWRRFYDFDGFAHVRFLDPRYRNKARKLDTIFNLRLENVPNYPHHPFEKHMRAISVRNLLRGFSFGLPCGEEVAAALGETPLTPDEVCKGPHEQVLKDPLFRGRTPLWYYILKEAELRGGSRLGPVGSRIVAETFVGLIRQSPNSILNTPGWQPAYGRKEPTTGRALFEMADLIDFARVVDPIGEHVSALGGGGDL